eukprot:125208-Hanusia_phi.AAC.6
MVLVSERCKRKISPCDQKGPDKHSETLLPSLCPHRRIPATELSSKSRLWSSTWQVRGSRSNSVTHPSTREQEEEAP